MSKQRVRADNFEQLIEIVKAVQRGKDPEESLREKEEQELRELLAQEEGEEELPGEERTPEEQQEDERAISRLLHRLRPGDGRNRDRGAGEHSNETDPDKEDTEEEPGQAHSEPDTAEEDAAGHVSADSDSGGDSEETAVGTNGSRKPAKPAFVRKFCGLFRKREIEPKHGKESSESVSVGTENAAGENLQNEEREDRRKRKPATALLVLRDHATSLIEKLAQKGFRYKEILFAGVGLLLAVLVGALIVHSVLLSRSEKRKMEGVTADEGLTVLIEKKPEQWCRSYPVELTVRAKDAQVEKATVNGTSYMLDEKGMLTAEVSEPTLNVSVDTPQGTLKAQVEIPLIDAQPPVINVTRQKDQIMVTAGDARSEIGKIRYAVVHDNAVSNVPEYQDYSEPLTFEKDSVYYFYAQDAAGNRCSPLVTTMEGAKTLSLSQEEVDLYPEETIYLNAQVEPKGALLNNLKYTSANPEVVTVENSGKVTAQGIGSTVVTVSADEVKEASCKVTVGESRSVTISAIGDCTLGTDANFNSNTSFDAFDIVDGHSWFFQNVRDILSDDDATFANLEGPLTEETQREIKQYAFKGDPSYTQILKNGSVDVVTLANNHSGDYGAQGLADTKRYLSEEGIDYCQDTEIALKDVNGILTAFIGIYVLDDGMDSEKDLREAISAAKEQGARLIIVAFHWGNEKETQPDATQQELAHIAVDCGANLVVGHHPHVIQGIEKYNGVYIAYSLGNFCFGGNSAPSDMDTMIFRQTFTVTRDGVLDDGKVEIIPCSISSEAYYNNYQPTPAQGAEGQRIIERVNEYSAAFGMTYSASDGTGSNVSADNASDEAANGTPADSASDEAANGTSADSASDEAANGTLAGNASDEVAGTAPSGTDDTVPSGTD